MFYMLSAYIAFLIGYSADLPQVLVFFVPVGFVLGYLLDRLSSVKKIWADDRLHIVKLVGQMYVFFFFVAVAIFLVAQFLASR